MRVNFDRRKGIIAALAGLFFLTAMFGGAYLVYGLAPTDWVFKDASPKVLNNDPVLNTPQYRDFYMVGVATKYQHDVQTGIPDPLRGAYNVLGVTTGDTSMQEAITIVHAAEKVAIKENSADGDAGLFTRNDELALGQLATVLEKALQSGTYPKVEFNKTPSVQNKTYVRLAGAGLLFLLVAVEMVLLWLLSRHDESSGKTIFQPSNYDESSDQTPLRESAFIPALTPVGSASPTHNATVRLSPTSPGTGQSIFAPPSRATVPIATNEIPIATFAPTVYRHGDDHYDEDFAINGPLGELVGECGASIADRIGLDVPSRASALSLWVFDKNDFQSTTKILMTDYAWNDTVTRSKLRSRGEAVQAMDGGVVGIETSTLRVEVQVSDLIFNTDKPDHSYYQSVTLTFKVFKRQVTV